MSTVGPTPGSRGSLGAGSPQSRVTRVRRGTPDCRSHRGSTPERRVDRRAPSWWLLCRGRERRRREYERGCGLEGQKKTVGAGLRVPAAPGGRQTPTRPCSPRTAEIRALAEWLAPAGGTPGAMESPGGYGPPLDKLREGLCTVVVVKAPHLTAVPGRKTEVLAAEGLAALWQPGLRRGSCLPSAAQRAGRELPRSRARVVADRGRQGER